MPLAQLSSQELPLIQPIVDADEVQVVIHGDAERAADWQPQRYRPSQLLARVDPMPNWLPGGDEEYSAPELAVPSQPSTPTVVLKKRIGKNDDVYNIGLFGDVYYASLRSNDSGQETDGLVAIVLDMLSFPTVGQPTQRTVRRFLGKEVHAYSLMAQLQGRAVPRFGGLFGRGSLFCLLYEDAGAQITEDEKYTTAIRRDIRQTFEDIRSAGVACLVLRWQNICRRPDGRINFTSFGGLSNTTADYTPDVEKGLQEGARRLGQVVWTPQKWLNNTSDNCRRKLEELLEYYSRNSSPTPSQDSEAE